MKLVPSSVVYVFYNPITKYTKIGVSDDVNRRQWELSYACGCNLDVLFVSKHLICSEKYESESHEHFTKYRTVGEWFNLIDPKDAVTYVDQLTQNATEDTIVELYKSGTSISLISSYMRVTRQAILARLKKYGVYDKKGDIYEKIPNAPTPFYKKKPVPKPSEKVANISKIYENTESLQLNHPSFKGEAKPYDAGSSSFKRIEDNIQANDQYYRISFFMPTGFIYKYTMDLDQARTALRVLRKEMREYQKTVIEEP